MRQSSPRGEPALSFWRGKPAIVLGMLAVIALFYVVREHYAHALGLLPYLILLLCPLMHLFGHHHRFTESERQGAPVIPTRRGWTLGWRRQAAAMARHRAAARIRGVRGPAHGLLTQ